MSDKNKWKRIQIITTGGTIEKTYDEIDGTLENRETVIKNRINQKIRLPYTELIISAIMAKDSLDMTEADRVLICDRIIDLHNLAGDPVVILHGTDTMQQTAELAAKRLQSLKAPIIFTGAMKPLGFEDSDALQNVTEALICAQLVSPKVYISFHNRLFDVPGVRKNKSKATFEYFTP